MNDLYEALIESSTPVVRSAPEGVRGARRAARSAARGRRVVHRRRHPPERRVRRRGARRDRALPGDSRRDARARLAHADGRRCTSTSGCPTPRPRSTPATACACTCRCCRRSPRPRRSGSARDSGPGVEPLARPSAPSRARRVPQDFAELGPLPGGHPLVRGHRRDPRLHVRVVGHPPEPEARHGRGARDGRARAGSSPSPGSPRWSTRWPSPARTAWRSSRRRPRASTNPRSAPRATGSTRRSGGAGRCGRCAKWARTRSRSRARTRASSTARTRSRRSSASCARAAARTACAPPTPPAGWTRCSPGSPRESYGSTQTTSPIAQPVVDRRGRSGPAPAGSRGWRCTAGTSA